MYEILRNLRSGARVLDLGSGPGSFPAECCPNAYVLRLDASLPRARSVEGLVLADAARLPFRDHTFDALISNHSLEHVADLPAVLNEIGRVIRKNASLYIAVPDASTISDRLYRWIYHGGGHVNPFESADALASRLTQATGLPLIGTRRLHTSLRFLARSNFEPRPPRRLWLVGYGNPTFTACLTYLLRSLDRIFGLRSSVYGWAFYFGELHEPLETAPWTNVCVACGAGHSEASLIANHRVRREFLFLRSYHCPNCGTWNLFTKDRPAKSGRQDDAAAAFGNTR